MDKEVDQLVEKAVSVPKDALKVALEEVRKRKEREAVDRAVRLLDQYEAYVQIKVEALRMLRKREKEARAKIAQATAAKDAFAKDGDIEAFEQALRSI